MKKNISIIIFLLVIVSAIVIFFRLAEKQNQACFESHCFNVELALIPEEQARGLMLREELGQNQGMLFVFQDEANRSFWMKNTLIPLDIIWLNKDKEVVFISKNTQPCKAEPCPLINPGELARYVLEVNAGIADKIGLRLGDKMSFRYH